MGHGQEAFDNSILLTKIRELPTLELCCIVLNDLSWVPKSIDYVFDDKDQGLLGCNTSYWLDLGPLSKVVHNHNCVLDSSFSRWE